MTEPPTESPHEALSECPQQPVRPASDAELSQLESKQVWVVGRCSGYPEQGLQKPFGLLEWCSLMKAVFACGSAHLVMLDPR